MDTVFAVSWFTVPGNEPALVVAPRHDTSLDTLVEGRIFRPEGFVEPGFRSACGLVITATGNVEIGILHNR